MIIGVNGDRQEDLLMLNTMVADGRLRPVIDSRFALDDIRAAYARVEGRHRRGSVVVSVADDMG